MTLNSGINRDVTTLGNSIATEARKALTYVVSGSSAHLGQIEQALTAIYTTLKFNDAKQALANIIRSAPAVVVVDEFIPPLGGIRLVSSIRAQPATRRIPVVFTAHGGHHETIAEAKSFGGVRILTKPYHRSMLIDAVSCQVSAKVEADWETIEPWRRRRRPPQQDRRGGAHTHRCGLGITYLNSARMPCSA